MGETFRFRLSLRSASICSMGFPWKSGFTMDIVHSVWFAIFERFHCWMWVQINRLTNRSMPLGYSINIFSRNPAEQEHPVRTKFPARVLPTSHSIGQAEDSWFSFLVITSRGRGAVLRIVILLQALLTIRSEAAVKTPKYRNTGCWKITRTRSPRRGALIRGRRVSKFRRTVNNLQVGKIIGVFDLTL